MDHDEPAFVAVERQFEQARASIEEVSPATRIQNAFDEMIEAKRGRLAEMGLPPLADAESRLSLPDPASVPMMKSVNPLP